MGEPRTARGPVSRGDETEFVPVERRNGDEPVDVLCCLATGLTCHVFGGGGVSLSLLDKHLIESNPFNKGIPKLIEFIRVVLLENEKICFFSIRFLCYDFIIR